MVEWDWVVINTDYELVTHMLHALYIISLGGVNIEGKELVWLCIVGDDYENDMVVDRKVR